MYITKRIVVSWTHEEEQKIQDFRRFLQDAAGKVKDLLPSFYKEPEINVPGNGYIVKSGDTLYSIALKNGVTIGELMDTNNLGNNILSVGQMLIIPNKMNYTVEKGDTLYSISKKFNTTVDKLKNDNNLNSNTLSIGQILII